MSDKEYKPNPGIQTAIKNKAKRLFVNSLGKLEGKKNHKDHLGYQTGAYGVLIDERKSNVFSKNYKIAKSVFGDDLTEQEFKDLTADEFKQVSEALFENNYDVMKSKYNAKFGPEFFNKLGPGAISVLSDVTYNTGDTYYSLPKSLLKYQDNPTQANLDDVLRHNIRKEGVYTDKDGKATKEKRLRRHHGLDNRNVKSLLSAGVIDENADISALTTVYDNINNSMNNLSQLVSASSDSDESVIDNSDDQYSVETREKVSPNGLLSEEELIQNHLQARKNAYDNKGSSSYNQELEKIVNKSVKTKLDQNQPDAIGVPSATRPSEKDISSISQAEVKPAEIAPLRMDIISTTPTPAAIPDESNFIGRSIDFIKSKMPRNNRVQKQDGGVAGLVKSTPKSRRQEKESAPEPTYTSSTVDSDELIAFMEAQGSNSELASNSELDSQIAEATQMIESRKANRKREEQLLNEPAQGNDFEDEEFAQGGEIGQGSQPQMQSQPIVNSGADRARELMKTFEGRDSGIDRDTRDELLKRIYDEQEAKKQQNQQGQQFSFGGDMKAGPGGIGGAVSTGVGMLGDLFGNIQDMNHGVGAGDNIKAVSSAAATAGTAVSSAIGEQNRVTDPEVDAGLETKGVVNVGAQVKAPNISMSTKFADGGSFWEDNAGLFMKTGAGLAQGLSNMGNVGEVVNPNLMDTSSKGYAKIDRDAIINSINNQTASARYNMENGAMNRSDLVSGNLAVNQQGIKAKTDATLQIDDINNQRKLASEAIDDRNEMFNIKQLDAAQDKMAMNAAVADDANSAAMNQLTNVGIGAGQDLINKGMAGRIGDAAMKQMIASGYLSTLPGNGKAEGGELDEDPILTAMKKRGYSERLINKILKR